MLPSVLPSVTADLSEHQDRIDRCIGIVCFEEVAVIFGTRSSNQLQVRIDDYVPLIDADGRKKWPGKYRKWLTGTAPSLGTVEKVERKSDGKSKLNYWRNLLLWNLLKEPFSWTLAVLPHMARYLEEPTYECVRQAISPDSRGRYPSTDLVHKLTLELRDLNTLDGYMALLLLAREGKLIKNEQRYVLAATCAFEVFPRIVMAHAHLHTCWALLYRCLEFAFWSRVYLEDTVTSFSIEIVRRQIAELQEDSKALLAPTVGHR